MAENSKNQSTNMQKTLRPGDDAQEDRLEESLEQLDNLLNGLKQGDAKSKEQEIAKLEKKYGIGNLGKDEESKQEGYGKKNQQLTLANKKAFDYEQPFNVKKQG